MHGKAFLLLLVLNHVFGNVQFFLYTRNNPTEGIELTDDLSQVNGSIPVKFIVHGWGENSERPYYREMTDAYLIKGDYSVIQVDWRLWASQPYFQAVHNTKKAGKLIGDLIVKLPVPLKNVHVIGHSLGAHVSGFTGKAVEQAKGAKIERISGLDPAGPGFKSGGDSERLTSEDARMVDITHTDINYFGYTAAMGTVDFYANGGHRPQPGCEVYNPTILKLNPRQIAFCSHTRSYLYFIEAINTEAMVATECSSLIDYETGECSGNRKIVYGENAPFESRGVYYFSTNPEKPFAIRSD